MSSPATSSHTGARAAAYRRIQQLIATDDCVILDGAMATELERVASPVPGQGLTGYRNPDNGLWGTAALYEAPGAVLQVHQRYVDIGCDVISTNTWGILNAPDINVEGWAQRRVRSPHWMDMARLGIRLGRQAITEAGRSEQCALAFAITGDVDSAQRLETISLLTRVFGEDPPDLILLETLSLIRDEVTFPTVELLLDTGLPVWLSFRRCPYGVCGVHGEHWGGPEGDLFGRAARRFEEMGVGALLINCLPPDHVPGMLSWLRNFTDLPLGVYPNLGYQTGAVGQPDSGSWQFDPDLGPEEYANLASEWREEGAQIIGGCCGVTPEHIAAARRRLAGQKPGRTRKAAPTWESVDYVLPPVSTAALEPWIDERDRTLFPLPLPQLVYEPGVFQPTQGSLLVWKYLFSTGAGNGKRCLDVGCGSGILTVQLALNGADHVHAIDIQREAVANMLSNAFRNGVAERVSGEAANLYAWQTAERYDLIVASLFQMPVDPFGQVRSHRPVDYWGRNLVDHLLGQLPQLLTDTGVAYVMQLSILSQIRTTQLAAHAGLQTRVVDFTFFPFSPIFQENKKQIEHVEQLSDAYHLVLGEQDVMVAYLLEVTRRDS